MQDNRERVRPLFLGLVPVILAVIFCATAGGDYTAVLSNGPELNRVNLVFLGDGYTADQAETTYVEHIDAMLAHLFNEDEDPYPRYRKFFNAYRINVVSRESGADVAPQGIYHDTAFDARYYYDGVSANSLYIDSAKVRRQLADNMQAATFTPAVVFVAVNDSRPGGGTGVYAAFAGGHPLGPEIALHEMGHAFNDLADEYGGDRTTYQGSEPSEVNVTTSPTGDKWAEWLGYNQPKIGEIGAYRGAYYYDYGVYSPSAGSKMRYLGKPFDAIAREKIILDIYSLVHPLDAWTDNATVLVDPDVIQVKTVDSAVIKVDWSVDGTPISPNPGEAFYPGDLGLEAGTYTITARAYDATDWVRRHRELLEQSVQWSVRLTTTAVVRSPGSNGSILVDNYTTGDNTTASDDKLVSSWNAPPAKAVEELNAVATVVNGQDLGGTFNPATWCALPAAAPLGFVLLGLALLGGSSLKQD